MKKYSFIILITLILGVFFFLNKALADVPVLNQKEVADLAKPSVVKIIQHVKGEAVVPEINVDFKNFQVTAKNDVSPKTIQVDEYLTGTGIILSPDGYILTNSHVISYQTIKNLIVSDFIYSAIESGYVNLGEAEAKKLSENHSPEEMADFGKNIADYMLAQSKFNLEKTLTVLNPTSQKETLEELVSDGFLATVISVNDNFYRDSRDAALLQIDQLNLPSIGMNPVEETSTGKKVYIFGYPATAEVSEKDILVPTFTQGTISATKDSLNKDFKILQTDAKISRGSSGGPLLNENGQVIGLVTFITSDFVKQDGDSFAFAIPIGVALDIIKNNKVAGELLPIFEAGTYNKYFLTGIGFLHNNQCKKALEEFGLAKKVNGNFPVIGFLEPYVKQCESIINAGNSIDTAWSTFRNKLNDTKFLISFIAIVMLILIGVSFALWYWFFRKMKRDAKELDNVEKYLHLNLEDGTPFAPRNDRRKKDNE